MEFIIAQGLFSKALSDVSKAVSSRTLLPILSGIKIVAEESVDGHFLLDALKTINDGEIKMKFSGSMKPIVIESAREESTYLHLISPVRSY